MASSRTRTTQASGAARSTRPATTRAEDEALQTGDANVTGDNQANMDDLRETTDEEVDAATGEDGAVSQEETGVDEGAEVLQPDPSAESRESARLAEEEAAQKVREAEKMLADAKSEHDTAKAQVDALVEVEHRDPLKSVGLDHSGSGTYEYLDAPSDYYRDRTIRVGRDNYEHVAEDGDGVWLYRKM